MADVRPRTARGLLEDALTKAADRVIAHEDLIRSRDEPEDVHQARVGIRRFRSTLRSFRPLMDKEWSDKARDAVRPLADVLGPARDADVLLARIRTHIAGHEQLAGTDGLLGALASLRDERRATLIASFDTSAHRRALASMRTAPSELELTGDDVVGCVRSAWRKLRRTEHRFGREPSDADLHRLRIQTKRARYAAEVLVSVAGDDARRFVRAAADLQDALGALQDAAVAKAWLLGLSGERTETAVHLLARETEDAQRARASWHHAWRRLDRSKVTHWLQ